MEIYCRYNRGQTSSRPVRLSGPDAPRCCMSRLALLAQGGARVNRGVEGPARSQGAGFERRTAQTHPQARGDNKQTLTAFILAPSKFAASFKWPCPLSILSDQTGKLMLVPILVRAQSRLRKDFRA